MSRLSRVPAIVLGSVLVIGAAQASNARLERALDAWDAGDYVAALAGFRSVLTAADGSRYFDRIALLTGELFTVTELATDGRSVQFSPDGRYAAFSLGARAGARVRVVEVGGTAPRVAAEIDGTSIAFSPVGGKVAFLPVKVTPEITKARADLERIPTEPGADRQAQAQAQQAPAALEAIGATLVVRDLSTGRDRVVGDAGLAMTALAFSADGRDVYVVASKPGDRSTSDLYAIAETSGSLRQLTSGPGLKGDVMVVPGGRTIVYRIRPGAAQAAPSGRPRASAGSEAASSDVVVLDLADRATTTFKGRAPVISADGSTLAFLAEIGGETVIQLVRLTGDRKPTIARTSSDRIASVALSPDGSRVTFDMPYAGSTEIFCVNADGTGEVRVSREIQPDRAPRFATSSTILAVKGERRHSRSYLYDLSTATGLRLFHNNTLRTIAPEYEWAVSPAGTAVLVVADRDGDTISPERGVYLIDLTKKTTERELIERLDRNLAAERALRAKADAQFKPVRRAIGAMTDQVSLRRIYEHEAALFDFDSKHITQPGNRAAADYIFNAFTSFGYQPEYQTFTARGGIRTSNVLATLRGRENPELIYVLSSHFDSNQRGPGADDNSSATAVLLETARLMAASPLPATVVFAAFTGEEAGLLGSREFVRQALERKLKVVGALNNDMIGWTNDHRLDNTVRYSNAGIRDLQHGAAFLFSKMVTYDSRYFQATDAAAYYEAYGDIVGGFGSYPVLGNPHYHQPTDLLETVNHRLLVEATKANIASIMRLAYGPSRVTGLKAQRTAGGAIEASWAPSPETGIVAYRVLYGAAGEAPQAPLRAVQPKVTIPAERLKSGATIEIAVTALTSRGLESWDAARAAVLSEK